jgi:hypothetical protein
MAEEKKKTEAEIAKDDKDKFRDKSIEDIPKLIMTAAADIYAKNAKDIKKLSGKNQFWEAASILKPKDEKIGENFFISYNSGTESLEPIYFWLLDFMTGVAGAPEKLIDNFSSSPGSGHFSELMGKATRMQEEGMKIMQTIGVLIKSVIQIIYDLRQFEVRFNDYNAAISNDKARAEAGLMALKQTWLDNVDIKRGNSSIKAMTFSQGGAFTTLLNAFFAVNNINDLEKNEFQLNDIVKRVLQQRLLEFEDWKKLSEFELRKRYNLERAWLKSQVESLKLYSRWAKPYFKAAEELKMSNSLGSNAALVKAFNTNLMQLVLFSKKAIDVAGESDAKELPSNFKKLAEKGKIRKYYACVLLDFRFRGIPQRVEQHYAFGGKSDVTFRSFALREDEIKELEKRLGESDIKDALKLVEGATTDSLKELEEDINHFLKDADERKIEKSAEEEEEKKASDTNPFTALIGIGTFWGKKSDKKDEKKEVNTKPDNYAEQMVRALARKKAAKSCFTIYDIYKKSHGMGSVDFSSTF